METARAPQIPIETAESEAAPAAAGTLPCASTPKAGGLTGRYVQVDDIDHLLRTGSVRQLLVIEWVR